jgi:flagellar hook protein FlgE
MLGSIYVGLSGLSAYSKGLQNVSTNVSNLNSLGYKATTVSFTDAFNQGGGGLGYARGSSDHAAGGVKLNAPRIDFRQGDLRQTENDLDLAINGSGFLVLLDGQDTVYARTGQFVVDKDGYVSTQAGRYRLAVLGPDRQPVAVNLDALRVSHPAATTTVRFADNLSSTATEATVGSIAVYDSNGGKQIWQIKFTATGATAPGEWKVTVTDQTNRAVGSGTVRFIGGAVDPANAKITIADTPAGADPLSVVLDFSNGVTAFSGGTASTLRAASTDGNAVGALTSVTINEDGQVKLTYSNTKTELAGAVALADFQDPQALHAAGQGLFANPDQAHVRLVESGSDGVGALVSRQLEASNVDLSQAFGDLILIQRGFQASSQVVSVTNDMIQQLFGMRGQG